MWLDTVRAKGLVSTFAIDYRDSILEHVHKRGGLLIRPTAFGGAEDFATFCKNMRLEEFDASESAAPRLRICEHVYTANEAPPTALIPFHHEMSQCSTHPRYVFFFCDEPPHQGGATPLVQSDDVARELRFQFPSVATELAQRGIAYRRVLPGLDDPTSPIGKSWPAALNAGSCAQAENILRERDLDWQWLSKGNLLTITKKRPVFWTNPQGIEVFFCSATAARAGWRDSRNDPKTSVVYGDDRTQLSEAANSFFDYASEYMHDTATRVAWKRGDVLVLDNTRVMHARDSFTPPRRILASLWGEALA